MSKILNAVYRAYGGELNKEDFKSFRFPWFDKFRCFKSAWDAFDRPDVNFTLVWDGSTDNDLYRYITKFPLHGIVHNENPGNVSSLLKAYDVMSESEDMAVYHIEDDFLHFPDSFSFLLGGLEFNPMVTLCDYNDRYRNGIAQTDITFGQEQILWHPKLKIHYRTCESTTCTVAFRKSFFDFCKLSLVEYALKGDGAPEDREWYRHMIRDGYRLINSIPGRSAHLVQGTVLEGLEEVWKGLNDDIDL